MRVLVVFPHYPPDMEHFTRGLAEAGAEIHAIADVEFSEIPQHVAKHITNYVRIQSFRDEDVALDECEAAFRDIDIERVECLWEPLVLFAGALRERLGLPGMTRDDVLAFRDKDVMKQRVRAAGLRVPKSRRVTYAREIREAAEEYGFPVVIKPIAGVCSADTYRVSSNKDIDDILPQIAHLKEGNVEEFIHGEEFTFDAIVINGVPAFYSVNPVPPDHARRAAARMDQPGRHDVCQSGHPQAQGGGKAWT
jgi:biotin carboxylase